MNRIYSDFKASIFDNITDATGWKTGDVEILSVWVENLVSRPETVFHGGERICVTILAVAHQSLDHPILEFHLCDRLGQVLLAENTLDYIDIHPTPVTTNQRFLGKFVFRLPMLPNGQYSVTTALANRTIDNHVQHHWLHDALIITVSSNKRRYGLVGIPFEQVTLEPCM